MANKKYHHLVKRGKTWHFRKGSARFSLGTTVATEAIQLRDKMLENELLTGHLVQPAIQEDEVLTFGKVAKEWATIHEEDVKYSTWRDYRSAMNTHVLPAFKDKPIEDITFLDVKRFITNLKCGGKRKNNILVPMRSVFEMAHIEGYVKDNIMSKVKNCPVEQPDIFPLSVEEVMRFIDVVEPFYKPYATVLFFTGLRDGEANGLLWSDYKAEMKPRPKLHINKSFVYGRDGKTKTKKSKRYVDCLDMVVKALEEQRKLTGDKEHIFLTKDGCRMTPDHFREVVWKKALKQAEIEYRPAIQTRHTFATMMISSGEALGWVKNMLGHSSLQMIYTRYYAWVPEKTKKDGSAFMAYLEEISVCEENGMETENKAKIISLFSENDTKATQAEKEKRKGSQI